MRTFSPPSILLLFLSFTPLAFAKPTTAQATLLRTNSVQEISGEDKNLRVQFTATQDDLDHVTVKVDLGTRKQVIAKLDYARKTVSLVSLSQTTHQPIAITAQDITTLQKLLRSVAPNVNLDSRVGDALTSFLNFLGSAPPGVVLNKQTEISRSGGVNVQADTFTPICNLIGAKTTANPLPFLSQTVTVGPQCYAEPAFGRCGKGGGPDLGIGLVQRFTQECLNHDQCCTVFGSNPVGPADLCGPETSGSNIPLCTPEFIAAAPGFFFAPDCGTTAGNWIDNFGITYAITGGAGSGVPSPLTGTSNTGGCGVWDVKGVRSGTTLVFSATNPLGESQPASECGAFYIVVANTPDCNVGGGTAADNSGRNAPWNWARQGTVQTAPQRSSGLSPTLRNP
jgi:hypothetical protein